MRLATDLTLKKEKLTERCGSRNIKNKCKKPEKINSDNELLPYQEIKHICN